MDEIEALRFHVQRARKIYRRRANRVRSPHRYRVRSQLGRKHPYDLVTGHYSVHTTADPLRRGESNIAAIGRRLHNQGVFVRKARAPARGQSDSARFDSARR
jgi:hypothetical protein